MGTQFKQEYFTQWEILHWEPLWVFVTVYYSPGYPQTTVNYPPASGSPVLG